MFLIISTMSLFNSYNINIMVIISERKISIRYPRGEVDHLYCCFRLKCLVFQLIMAQPKHELGIYVTYEMIKWQ